MGERAVGVGHSMCCLSRFLTPPPRLAAASRIPPQPFLHRFFAARTSRRDEPSHRERIAPDGPHFDWNLIVGAADPAGANLDRGRTLSSARLKTTRPSSLERSRRDRAPGRRSARRATSGRVHHDVHELRDGAVVILGVCGDFATRICPLRDILFYLKYNLT